MEARKQRLCYLWHNCSLVQPENVIVLCTLANRLAIGNRHFAWNDGEARGLINCHAQFIARNCQTFYVVGAPVTAVTVFALTLAFEFNAALNYAKLALALTDGMIVNNLVRDR